MVSVTSSPPMMEQHRGSNYRVVHMRDLIQRLQEAFPDHQPQDLEWQPWPDLPQLMREEHPLHQQVQIVHQLNPNQDKTESMVFAWWKI